MKILHSGFDIGTDTVTAVLTDARRSVIEAFPPLFHFGNPVAALAEIINRIDTEYGLESVVSMAFTGSCGEKPAEHLNIPFFHDTITIPEGAKSLAWETDYIFHMGAKDAYFFHIETLDKAERDFRFVADHGTCTKCGGGSGILLTRQCRRFFEAESNPKDNPTDDLNKCTDLNLLFDLAETSVSKSDRRIDVGGRCGVVIQSDMIHLQNSGESITDILAGLYRRIIANFKADVLKTWLPVSGMKACVTGGIFASDFMLSELRTALGIEIQRPEYFRHAGAVGAISKAAGTKSTFTLKQLMQLETMEKKSISFLGPLKDHLKKVRIHNEPEAGHQIGDLRILPSDRSVTQPVILGIDGGSTTTKAVIMDASGQEIIGHICLYTNGKPLETIQKIFRQIKEGFTAPLQIAAVAYTGSSGPFYSRMFTAPRNGNSDAVSLDIVKDEITCHALGVKHFSSNVDTIFELGGQDAKFTLFDRGNSVKKSKMNLSCMAGTGQTMQNMVEMIGLNINDTFHEAALSAERTPVVDDTCGVFTEAGIARLIALGFPTSEIAAAIAYGFIGGYVNKFIGNESFGSFASAQGGPFNGTACLAALAMHTDMEIQALPYRQLFGAIGAAIAAAQNLMQIKADANNSVCLFRGFDLADEIFRKHERPCSLEIPETCQIRDCRLNIYESAQGKILTGGACPKGNSGERIKKAPDYITLYKKILRNHLTLYSENGNERVLIPASLTFMSGKGVFFSALYHRLGFTIVTSPESTDEIVREGFRFAHSEACFPVKLAHGHIAFLKKEMKKGRDKLLLLNAIGTDPSKHKYCPYISGAGFLAKCAADIDNSDVLLPAIHFNDPDFPVSNIIADDLIRVFGNRFPKETIDEAVAFAEKSEHEFHNDIWQAGDKILKQLRKSKKTIYLGIGRHYTMFDDKAGSSVQSLFAERGLHFLPAAFLRPDGTDIDSVTENMYWVQGREIIRHTLMASLAPDLFPVRLTNFNCGSDSILLFHEERIIKKSEKPHLVLQTDGHNNNAQFGTRITANAEVVKNYRFRRTSFSDYQFKNRETVFKGNILGIPFIGDSSHVIAASFKALGYNAEVIPTNTEASKYYASKINGTNICLPFSYQVGDCLSWLDDFSSRHGDPNKRAVIIEPTAKGPCRFGQYNVLLKQIFAENGYSGVQVCSPDADRDYINIPFSDRELMFHAMMFFKGIFCLDMLYDALLRTRPYERTDGEAQRLYDSYLNRLLSLLENKASTKKLLKFITGARREFESIPDDAIPRKPLVALTGEIFVRLHPEANSNSILLLEKHGLEVQLSPLTQWMEYANGESIKKFKLAGTWKKFIIASIKRYYMKSRRKKLIRPFYDLLSDRQPHSLHHILGLIEEDFVYNKKIEGESPISIGESLLFAKEQAPDISGIYHVGPFGCMQETAATSQINAINRKHRQDSVSISGKLIPYMDAVFGESDLSNIDAEVAAFAEKCYLKQKLNKNLI